MKIRNSELRSLAIIEHLEDDFVVMNGDILTTINYEDLYQYHLRNSNDATISTYRKEVKIDLGVLGWRIAILKIILRSPLIILM